MICGIYKITNKINGKCYIGQSVNIEQRWREHRARYLSIDEENYKKPLYIAMRKYGIKEFDFSIIEQCLPEELNEKEIYWINYYNSLVKNNGYNISLGFQPVHFRKINDIDFNNICQDLKNNILTINEISEKYKISLSYVYEINRGDSRPDLKEEYPLRNIEGNKKITEEEFLELKQDLKNGLPLQDIANKFNISKDYLSDINHGRKRKQDNENYPLHNYEEDTNLTDEQISEILNLIANTKLSLKEIGKKYNRSKSTITAINTGDRYRREGIEYPIRKNKRVFLKEEQILEIYNYLINSTLSLKEIREKYNIGEITLYYINTGYTHKHEGYEYPLRK